MIENNMWPRPHVRGLSRATWHRAEVSPPAGVLAKPFSRVLHSTSPLLAESKDDVLLGVLARRAIAA